MPGTTGTENDPRARHSIMIATKLFRDTHDAVDGLRTEVSARRCSEHQGDIGKSNLGSSRYANRERRLLTLRGKRRETPIS